MVLLNRRLKFIHISFFKRIKKKLTKLKNRLFKFLTLRIIFPMWYWFWSHREIDSSKVIFVEIRLPEVSNNFTLLLKKLSEEYTFKIKIHFLRLSFVSKWEYVLRCLLAIKDISDAKYVFTNEASNVLSSFNLRSGTQMVQTWHGCGAFKKFGFSTSELIFGESYAEKKKYPYYKNETIVTVSSPEVVWAYQEAMGLDEKRIEPLGNSRTDIFYDTNFIESSFQKLYKIMPEAKGKKVILYAPTFRGRVAKAVTSHMLNVEMFAEAFRDEYVLLFKHHPLAKNLPTIKSIFNDFAKDVTKKMAIEELLCIADVVIADYSSLVFEYSLFERPMIFFAYDLEEYYDWRGFYYPYDEFVPGPIVKTNREIIEQIRNINDIDLEKVKAFKHKFMSSCDGQATERLLKIVFDDDLDKYRKLMPEKVKLNNLQTEKKVSVRNLLKQKVKKIFYQKIVPNAASKYILKERNKQDIVFIEQSRKDLSTEFKSIYEQMVDQDYKIKTIYLYMSKLKKLNYLKASIKALETLSNAKLIFIKENIYLLEDAVFSPETKMICLLSGKFSLLDQVQQENILMQWKAKKYIDRIYFTASGHAVEKVLQENRIEHYIKGLPQSDILFNEEFQKNAYLKLAEKAPLLNERKVILVLPSGNNSSLLQMDYQQLYEYLSDQYIILLSYPAKVKKMKIPKMYTDFVFDISGVLSYFEAVVVADLCIADKGMRIAESVILSRKILFHNINLVDNRSYFDNAVFEEFYRRNVTKTTKELIGAIQSAQFLDPKQEEIKEKYYTFCDGKVISNAIGNLV